jgi:predicted nucleotidyltransferase
MRYSTAISTLKQKTLVFFCIQTGQRFHEREVARQAGLNAASVHRAVKSLEKEGFLLSERKGRMIFYQLDESRPLVRAYKAAAVVFSLEPLVDKLRRITDQVVLYGSSIRGEYLFDSDVDLFILTNHEDKVFDAISRFSRGFTKEIKPVIYSLAEWVTAEGKNPAYAQEIGRGLVLYQSEYYASEI